MTSHPPCIISYVASHGQVLLMLLFCSCSSCCCCCCCWPGHLSTGNPRDVMYKHPSDARAAPEWVLSEALRTIQRRRWSFLTWSQWQMSRVNTFPAWWMNESLYRECRHQRQDHDVALWVISSNPSMFISYLLSEPETGSRRSCSLFEPHTDDSCWCRFVNYRTPCVIPDVAVDDIFWTISQWRENKILYNASFFFLFHLRLFRSSWMEFLNIIRPGRSTFIVLFFPPLFAAGGSSRRNIPFWCL